MDAIDIYEDLDLDFGEQVEKLQQENAKLVTHIAKLENNIDELKKEITTMTKTQENLSHNISELFNTAKQELARKDRMITELRKQLDNIMLKKSETNVGKRSYDHSFSNPESKRSRSGSIPNDGSKSEPINIEKFDNRNHHKSEYKLHPIYPSNPYKYQKSVPDKYGKGNKSNRYSRDVSNERDRSRSQSATQKSNDEYVQTYSRKNTENSTFSENLISKTNVHNKTDDKNNKNAVKISLDRNLLGSKADNKLHNRSQKDSTISKTSSEAKNGSKSYKNDDKVHNDVMKLERIPKKHISNEKGKDEKPNINHHTSAKSKMSDHGIIKIKTKIDPSKNVKKCSDVAGKIVEKVNVLSVVNLETPMDINLLKENCVNQCTEENKIDTSSKTVLINSNILFKDESMLSDKDISEVFSENDSSLQHVSSDSVELVCNKRRRRCVVQIKN